MKLHINRSDVMSVYSGKPGCACGCRGKHTYVKAFQKQASTERGYEVKNNEVNDRVVNLIVNTMQNAIAETPDAEVRVSSHHIAVELPNRVYVAYFSKAVR